MSTAMQSRMVHLHLNVNASEWTSWALKAGLDPRVVAYIDYCPDQLMSFSPDHDDCTFACPRTWEFASKLIEDTQHLTTKTFKPLLAGTLGEGTAIQFLNFCAIYADLVKLSEILKDPEHLRVPEEPATQFALVGMLGGAANEDNLPKIMPYVSRLGIEFQILFVKKVVINLTPAIAIRNEQLREWTKINGTKYAQI